MLFSNNDGNSSDRILYKTKPNMLLGCKKAIIGVIILIIVLMISPMAIKFIGEMQVYMISQIKLSLTRYVAIAFFIIILIDVIYIIWQLIGWNATEYALTDTKIIIKSGVLSTKRNYMPYATIQDINTSQSFIAKIFNVGSVSVYSAYDNNQMELKNISKPSEVEEIIFSRMVGPRNFQSPPPQQQIFNQRSFPERDMHQNDDYLGRNDYYDEYEPITPITHERNAYPRRDYEYYPEDFEVNREPQHKYEYEPYDGGYNNSRQKSFQNPKSERYYEPQYDDSYRAPNAERYYEPPHDDSYRASNAERYYEPPHDNYYNQVRDEYSYNDDHYHDNGSELYYNDGVDYFSQNKKEDIDDSSNDVIRRHFDKFKK